MGCKPRRRPLKIVAGYGFSDKEVQTAYPITQQLRNQHGKLNDKIILAEAKRPSSKLHAMWDWDVAKAAEKHWLRRAADLLRAVHCCVTVIKDGKPKNTHVRIWHSVEKNVGAQGGGVARSHEHIEDIMNDDQMRQQIVDGFIARMEQLRKAYATFIELEPIFRAVDRVRREQSK